MQVKCSHCGKLLRVPDEAAGKKGKWPACKEIFLLSQPSDGASNRSRDFPEDTSFNSTSDRSAKKSVRPLAEKMKTMCSWMIKVAALTVLLFSLGPLIFGLDGDFVAIWALACFVVGILLWLLSDRLISRRVPQTEEVV